MMPTGAFRRLPLRVSLHLTLLAACSGEVPKVPAAATSWSDPAPHRNDTVMVNGIRVNYLDWGGAGNPLILLHGMGDNAHIFDDLVPALGSGFHVIAYSRRGHGHSGKEGPYHTATLVEDLRLLMDSLGIAKASLAGWSHAGNEISLMAATYPERVDRIVYLEAAYDWGDPALTPIFGHFPVPFNPTGESLGSLEAFRAWQLRNFFPGILDSLRLEAYFRNLVDIDLDGTVRLMATDSITTAQFVTGYRRDYTKIQAPALVIAAETYLDVEHGDSAQRVKNLAWDRTYMAPFRQASLARARRELPNIREVVTVPGAHPDFVLVSRARVADAMRRFLGN